MNLNEMHCTDATSTDTESEAAERRTIRRPQVADRKQEKWTARRTWSRGFGFGLDGRRGLAWNDFKK